MPRSHWALPGKAARGVTIREPGDRPFERLRASGGVPRGHPRVARVAVDPRLCRDLSAASTLDRAQCGARSEQTRVDPRVADIAPTRLYVCTTCRTEGDIAGPRAGARLFEALKEAAGADPAVELVPVECLSVCRRACTVSLAALGKWTYIYGDLPAEGGAPLILDALRLYAATPDGLIPWKQRSDPIKKGVVARLPPTPYPPSRKDIA